MKKLNCLIAFIALSAACLQAAPEPTVSLTAGGTEKVVSADVAIHDGYDAVFTGASSTPAIDVGITPSATAKVAFQNVGSPQQSCHAYALVASVSKLASTQPNQPTAGLDESRMPAVIVSANGTHNRLTGIAPDNPGRAPLAEGQDRIS